MTRLLFTFSAFLVFFSVSAQKDSIFIQAKLDKTGREILVHQKIIYHNPLDKSINKIKLLNWISAYKNRKTPLLKRKIEDHKNNLYFATENELGVLEKLKIHIGNSEFENQNLSRESLYIPLLKNLSSGEKTEIILDYQLRLPSDQFTGYGYSSDDINLKYFFLVPDGLENNEQSERNYLDIEENQKSNTFWDIKLEVPDLYYAKSNLIEKENLHFQGFLKNDPEFNISKKLYPSLDFTLNNKEVKIDFGYPLPKNEISNLEFLLPLQLKFINEKTGLLSSKIFLTKKFKIDEDFIGNNDIHFWKFHYKLFSDAANSDMDYIGILAKNTLNQNISYSKENDHWLINGLKSYIEIEYLKTFYKNEKLLGDLPNEVKLFGLKPLKLFFASKLKLTDRYGLAYQYAISENLDQRIKIPYSKLSNLNKTIISNFETGSLIDFISTKMGTQNFDSFVRNYLKSNENAVLNTSQFLDQLTIASGYSSEFLENYITEKQRINFNLKSYKKEGENLRVKIAKNTVEKIPFKIETEESNGNKQTYWFDTSTSEEPTTYIIPRADARKILINNNYSFPESNYRDNYLYTNGLFSNTKRLKFKILQDIPNPEYNEIYLNPRLNFNVYDKLLLGLNFKNISLFNRKFAYSVTPYFSTGTNKITGSGGVSYSFMPPNSFYRSLSFGASASYFHYDYNLSYSQVGLGASMNFSKNPRTDLSRTLSFSYNHYEKDLTPLMVLKNEYSKYNLWGISYNYNNPMLIHEHYIGGSFQTMEDFQKISANAYYRYEYSKNKKISFRIFAGYFLRNSSRNNLFDFGVSKVSNYTFSYGLLGQSATSGLFAQQMVIADGAFKSYVATSANQWIGTMNVDAQIWKWFHLYTDIGQIKNKNFNSQFIWDSGVKLAILPDFLELYFPIQSSLGFEPGFKDYGNRIRFTFNFNLGALTSNLRKGVF